MPRSRQVTPPEPAALAARVRRNLVRRCRIHSGDRLLVAVSAGADSVALLHLLADIAPRLGLALEVAHFDHALRADSEADARFVAELAREHGLPFHSALWATPTSGEAAARDARYAFLESIALAQHCDAIALAHHLDDQIETAILRLERGSGLRGAGGMRWRRKGAVHVVRPLLDVRSRELRRYLESAGKKWREDPSNTDASLARNRIRSAVLPTLDAALRPGWMERWGVQLEELRAVSAWIDRLARETLHAAAVTPETDVLERGPLRDAPEFVRRRVLHRWFEAVWRRSGHGARPPVRKQTLRRHLEEASRIVRIGQSGQSLDLPGGWSLHLEQGRVRLVPPHGTARAGGGNRPRRAEDPASAAAEPPGYRLEVHPEPVAHSTAGSKSSGAERQRFAPADGPEAPSHPPLAAEVLLSGDDLEGPLRWRHPQPGDQVRLLGAPGRRKLYRLFQDRRIPRRLRSSWPVVEDAQGIVWVPGVGLAERARLHGGSQRVLRLRLEALGLPAAPPGRDLVQDEPEP